MKRKVLVLVFVIAFFGFGLITPTTNFESISRQLQDQPYRLEYAPSGIGDNTYDYVDQLSDLHPLSDIGTHNVFTDLQADDTNYDALTEADQGIAGNNVQDTVDSDATDIDSSPDVGTQGIFANAQDLADADYMTLQEADQGTADMTAEYSPTSYTNLLADVTNPTYAYDGSLTTFAYQDIGVDRSPAYELITWETGTGIITNVDLVVRFSIGTLTNDQYGMFWKVSTSADQTLWAMSGTSRALNNYTFTSLTEPNDGTWSWTDIQNFVLFWNTEKVTNSDAVNLNYYEAVLKVNVSGTTDYELDFEYQWTGADYDETNEEVCINVQTAAQGGENLKAWEWTGSDWATLGTCSFDGWNNFTASYLTSATYYIKLNDSLQSDETTPSTWDIDSMILHVWTDPVVDYELDLEVGWTTADFDETNEELCIYPVTGGGWPAENILVDVWNGAWTNVIADLTPDQWNNVSISSYLTGAAFEIRFLGGTETGDTTQDSWEIDAVLIHTWTPSYTPANDQAPTLDNPSDTDNMYAQYLEYQVTVYVSDQNGFADIAYLEIGLWNDTQDTEYCRFRYDEDTNTFTVVYDIGTAVSLNTVSSTATESGNDIDATFHFTVDWDFPDSSNLDANCTVIDAQSESSETWYEVNWNVETRLAYSGSPSIDDGSGTSDRGDLDGSFSLTGTVIYYTSVDDYPSSTAVDVWVSAPGIGNWSDLILTSGAFDVTCYANDVVGEDTYTIKVVEEGTGVTGTDLYHTTSATDTYIADRLIITMTDPIDQRINIGDNATGIIVSAIYDFDDTAFDGTLTLNDTTFDYGTVGQRGYTVTTASGGAHGVSLIGINDETHCIWDSLTISITDPGDQHINVGENATGIIVSAVYDYDGSAFDGTFTLNNTLFLYGTAQRQDYTVQLVSGGIHTITIISSNAVTYCIWDSLTITITDPLDQRQNVNVNATGIIVSAVYDYDGSPFDGSFTMNNTQFMYGTAQRQDYTVESVNGGLHGITNISTNDVTYFIWDSLTITITDPSDSRIDIDTAAIGIGATAVYDYDGAAFDGTLTLNNTQFTYSTAQIQWYTIGSVSDGTHGITAIRINDQTWCIWDSLTISITGPDDTRINIDTAAAGIVASAVYDYDGTAFDGTLTLNNTLFTYSVAQIQWYTVSSVSADTYGITAINTNDDTWCIWDSLTITIADPGDFRIDIDTAASGIVATAVYDYDGSAFDGTLTLNNTLFTYSVAQIQWYTVESASADTYGITTIKTDDQTWCIWDSLTITITDPGDQRQNVGVNATGIFVSAIYDYDGSAFDGSVILNNTQFLYGTAQRQDYTVGLVSGGAHGITNISTNDVIYFIWDSLTISITDPGDQRQNVGVNATGIIVSAVYDYDGFVFDGSLTLNNTQFLYGTAQRQDYTVESVSGGIHGITEISANDVTYFIWDSLTISTAGPSDQRINVNANASGIIVSAVYDYDGSSFDGTFTMNNTVFSYSDVRREGYTVDSVSGGVHSITVISANAETWCIWDQITVRDYSVLDNRVNINDNVGINVTVEYEYDDTPVTDGSLTINGIFADHLGSGIWNITVFEIAVGLNIYHTVVCASNLHGIISMNQDSQTQTVIWDRVQVQSYSVADNHVNINDNVNIDVTLRYDYDNSPVTDGSVTINGLSATPLGAGVWQVTDSKSSVQLFTYDTVACSGNTLGITAVDDNYQSQDVIWDRVQVQSYSVSDTRASLGANVDINVTLVYDYYDAPVIDGTVDINGQSATHLVSGVWRLTDSEAGVISNLYNAVTCSGNFLGITVVDDNGQSVTVIWDRLVITIGVDDSTPNNGIQANFTLSVEFDFDNTPCTTYQIVIQRNGTWWHSFTDANKTSFVDTNSDRTYTYTVQLVTSESTYTILTFSSNSLQVVWSAIPNNAPTNDVDPVLTNPDDGFMFARYNFYIITSNASDADGFIDIQYVELTLYENTTTSPIWTVRYTVSGGVFSIVLGSAYIELGPSSYATEFGNDLDITWYIKINWTHIDMLNTVPHQFVTDGTASDSDYSITTWDIETRLDYSTTPSLSDDRGEVDTSDLVATGSVIYLGSTYNPLANETDVWVFHDVADTWSGNLAAGSFSISSIGSSSSVRLNTYTFIVVEEGAGSAGTDLYYTSSATDTYITDRLIITLTDPTFQRINIGENATGIILSAIYDFDDTAFDGTLTLNDTTFDYGTVGRRGYTVTIASGGIHGVSFIGVNDATYCIWDSLTISITDPPDQHINTGENATGIIVSAVYDYDGSTFDGTLTLNNTQFLYGTAQRQDYTVELVSGGVHGITTISSNDVTYCIWDSLTITITDPLDQRQNVNVNATGIIVSAVYDYDGSAFDGTLTLNNTQYSYPTAQRQDYTVLSVSGGVHGIIAISSNDVTFFIWDSLTISITDSGNQRINIDTAVAGIVATAIYDYDGSAFDGTLTLNNTQFTYSTAQIQWYIVESASGGTHGITEISSNDATYCIWDSLTISFTDPGDQRININTAVAGITATAIYDYDGSAFDGTLTLNNSQFTYSTAQIQWYEVETASGGTHGISAISTNDVTWCIWDQLIIDIGVDDSSLLNGHQANFTLTITYSYDGGTCTTYQIVIDRDVTWWHSFTDANVTQFVDSNTDITYLYNASLVSSESTYDITAFTTNPLQVTWSLAPNEIPVNDSSPVLTNGDDTDYLFARYRYYVITTSVSDLDGYANLSFVEISLFPDDLSILYWTIRYTSSTDTFSVEFGGSVVMIGAMSNAVGVGNTLTVTWHIKIGWDQPDSENTDVQQFVSDGIDSDSDFYENNWNVETRLDYSTGPSLSDDRGDINTADLIGTGSVTYYGSSHSPLSNETDVWVLHDVSGTWGGDLSVGSFSIPNIGSSATVQLNIYTFKVVVEGGGSGGTDLYFSTSLTDTFITDRIEIYEVGVVDGRIDINSDCDVWWRARYEFDSTEIQTGLTLELNGSRILIWNLGSSYWLWQETSTSPSSAGFYVISASESTYGLTVWFDPTSVQQVIWDRIKVTSVTATTLDSVDAGVSVEIRVTLVYEFDDTAVTDGTVNLDNGGVPTAMTYNAAGYWSASVSRTTTGNFTFTVDSVSSNTHGITSLDTDELSVQVEWVGAPGFVPDTMTLMIVGGGAGIALIGAAIVASRRRRRAVAVGEIDTTGFGVPEIIEDAPLEEPVSVEVEEEPIPEPEVEQEDIEPSEPEVAVEPEVEEVEVDVAEEAIEPEPEEVELPPVDEELADVEDIEIEPEPEIIEELTIEPEIEPEVEAIEEIPEEIEAPVEEELVIEPEAAVVEEPAIEPEVEPEGADYDAIPEEFIEPEAPVNLSKLTKRELLELIPDDIKETTSPNELKRLTKKELISLVGSFNNI